MAFGQLLRREGLATTPGRLIDAARSLEQLECTDAPAFRAALRANLTISVDDFALFDAAFDAFWLDKLPPRRASVSTPATTIQNRPEGAPVYLQVPLALEGVSAEGEARLPGGSRTAGEADILTKKDFRDYTAADIPRARRLVRQLRPSLATAPSRRSEPASSGSIDLRRTVRLARRRGEVVELARKRRKLRRLRVVVLCDVSGSMDAYANHLLQVFAALQAESGGVHTFVFSTRLHEVTAVLRRKRFDAVLGGLSDSVEAWSGGTTIGACLAEFNRHYGKSLIGPRTVVIIASDGWERGDPAALGREMRLIRRRAQRIIWLNPLKAREGYEPLAVGMAAALPHVDHFLAANSLAALERLKQVLAAG